MVPCGRRLREEEVSGGGAQGRAGCSVFIPAGALLPYTKHDFGHPQR